MLGVSLRLERAQASSQPLGVVPNGYYYRYEKVGFQNETSFDFGALAITDAGWNA